MQIPESLRAFREPTLIVVTDNTQAKLFLAKDRQVELIKTLSTKLEKSDQDRVAVKLSSGMMVSGEQHEDNQDWTREHLYSELSKDLMRRLQNKEFEALILASPQENENELKESLHINLLKVLKMFIPKLLTNEELLDIVTYAEEEWAVEFTLGGNRFSS